MGHPYLRFEHKTMWVGEGGRSWGVGITSRRPAQYGEEAHQSDEVEISRTHAYHAPNKIAKCYYRQRSKEGSGRESKLEAILTNAGTVCERERY